MEPMMPNSGEEESKLDWSEHGQEKAGLTKKQRILIVVGALGALLLVAGLLFLSRGGKPDKQSKAVPAVNRGLMQAETIRAQKDMLDGKSKRGNEDEWERKFQAFRGNDPKPILIDTMPDPVPMFPSTRTEEPSDAADPRGTKPSSSPSMFGNIAKSLPGMPKNPSASSSSPTPDGIDEAPPVTFKPSDRMTKQMSDEYQKALAFNSSEQLVFTRTRTDEGAKGNTPSAAPASPKPGHSKVIVSAGDEMVAVLNESISSDYPSVAKATLTAPAELAGSTLLLSYALGQERMTAQVTKLILPAREGERAREQTLSAVVKSGLPGLAGDVSHHWLPQIAAGMANAGLTAGALYYAAQNQNKDLGTAVLVAPMIEQSVQGVLKPVNYLGRDRPVTVTVPAGTEFKLLVTDGFEVEL